MGAQVGAPGSCGDSHIWESSKMFRDLDSGLGDDGWRGWIPPGHYIAADNAYKLTTWIMRPHKTNEFSNDPAAERRQTYFSRTLRIARRVVERVIGMLKKRFISLVAPLEDSLERRKQTVWAALILHNILLDHKFPLFDDPNFDAVSYATARAHLKLAIREDRLRQGDAIQSSSSGEEGGDEKEEDEEEEEKDDRQSARHVAQLLAQVTNRVTRQQRAVRGRGGGAGAARALRAAQNSMRHARTRRGRLAASQSRPHLFRRRTGTGRLLGEDEESDASDVFRDDADDAASASEDSGGDSDDSRAPTRRGRGRKRRRAGDGEEGGASTRKAATAAQARRKYIDKVVERVVAESDSLSSIPSPSDVDIGGIPDLRAVQDDETDVDSDSSADSARIRDLAPRQGKLFRDKLANEVYADHVERWRRSSRNARV